MRVFAPRLVSLPFDVCSFVGEVLPPPSWQHLAAAVSTQHLCRHRHRHRHRRNAWPFAVPYLFPSRLLTCNAASNPTDQPPNPWTAKYLHPSRCNIIVQYLKYMVTKTRRRQRREKGGNAIKKNRRIKPLHFWSQDPAARTYGSTVLQQCNI